MQIPNTQGFRLNRRFTNVDAQHLYGISADFGRGEKRRLKALPQNRVSYC